MKALTLKNQKVRRVLRRAIADAHLNRRYAIDRCKIGLEELKGQPVKEEAMRRHIAKMEEEKAVLEELLGQIGT